MGTVSKPNLTLTGCAVLPPCLPPPKHSPFCMCGVGPSPLHTYVCVCRGGGGLLDRSYVYTFLVGLFYVSDRALLRVYWGSFMCLLGLFYVSIRALLRATSGGTHAPHAAHTPHMRHTRPTCGPRVILLAEFLRVHISSRALLCV